MQNITIVFTRHEELGKCNSNALYEIFKSIEPEIIFEEIPPSYFDAYYVSKTKENLETIVIKKYANNFHIKHIQVDSDNVPSNKFFQDNENLHKRIKGLTDVNGFNYRSFVDESKMLTSLYGFEYLNSIYCSNINDKIYGAIEQGLKKINNESLLQIYQTWKAINEIRENTMLRNIYDYSRVSSYRNAIFTIGAGHRKSILQKIETYKNKENLELSWTLL